MGLESSVGEKPACGLPALSSGAAACVDFSDIIDNFMIFDLLKLVILKFVIPSSGANGNFVSVSS